MANVDAPRGFQPQHQDIQPRYWQAAGSQTWKAGDPLTLSSGQLALATAASTTIVIAAEDQTSTTAGDLVGYYPPDTVFQIQCDSGTAYVVATHSGKTCDIIGSTGAFEVDLNAQVTNVVRVIGLSDVTTGNGNVNAVGANAILDVVVARHCFGAHQHERDFNYSAGAPSTTPEAIGDVNFDTTNGDVYIATGTSSSADWTLLGKDGEFLDGFAITSQAGNPSSTPASVGDLNIDSTAGDLHIATGTSSSADWKLLAKDGEPIDGLLLQTAAGVPGTTPASVGDLAINTTGGDVFVASGTSAATDWDRLQKIQVSQAGVPATAPAAVGDLSLDTTNGILYQAKAATAAINFVALALNLPLRRDADGTVAPIAGDGVIGCDYTATGTVAVTMPAVADSAGQWYCIADTGGNATTQAITITPTDGTINGDATIVINKNHGFFILGCDGSNWYGFGTLA